jgi:hypothetical protein
MLKIGDKVEITHSLCKNQYNRLSKHTYPNSRIELIGMQTTIKNIYKDKDGNKVFELNEIDNVDFNYNIFHDDELRKVKKNNNKMYKFIDTITKEEKYSVIEIKGVRYEISHKCDILTLLSGTYKIDHVRKTMEEIL